MPAVCYLSEMMVLHGQTVLPSSHDRAFIDEVRHRRRLTQRRGGTATAFRDTPWCLPATQRLLVGSTPGRPTSAVHQRQQELYKLVRHWPTRDR